MADNAPTAGQFQAYYLQRATVELAEDLDALRTADDFALSAGRSKAHAAAGSGSGSGSGSGIGSGSGESAGGSGSAAAPPASTFDTPLQMLIEALRQGAEMFGVEDQKRVVAGGQPQKKP